VIDLLNGAEFFDLESRREMLVKLWNGQPWLFYRQERGGDWISLRAATEEDMTILEAAYQEALNRQPALSKAYGQTLPMRKVSA
jgi:hypothetical protein